MKRADWLGTGQGKLDYELGINRRNKLCRWIEVAGKIEFADSTALVGEKGPDKKKKKRKEKERRRRKKRAKGKPRTDKSLKVSRRWFLANCFPLFSSPRRFPCLHYRSRQQLFDPAVGTNFIANRNLSRRRFSTFLYLSTR